jgi:diaminopimelate epimerase
VRAGGKLGRGEFARYHALGNDYLVVDPSRFGVRLTKARIRQLCDRRTGVGSDGILAPVSAAGADFGLRIYNPDGSQAEKSGNGVRIFARFLHDFGYTRKRRLAIATRGGVVGAELHLRGGAVDQIRVEMGRARFDSRAIPVRGRRREVVSELLRVAGRLFRVTCVSVGNPHCVIFVRRLSPGALRRFGPQIETHRRFPKRINVQFARVVNRRTIEALVWERGAGETRASGSSACAVVAAAVMTGRSARRVTVRMPGGSLAVEVGEDDELVLTGSATPIARGRLLAP